MQQAAVLQIEPGRCSQMLPEQFIQMVRGNPQFRGNIPDLDFRVGKILIQQTFALEKGRISLPFRFGMPGGIQHRTQNLEKNPQPLKLGTEGIRRDFKKLPEHGSKLTGLFRVQLETGGKTNIITGVKPGGIFRLEFRGFILKNPDPAFILMRGTIPEPVKMNALMGTGRIRNRTVLMTGRNNYDRPGLAEKSLMLRDHPAAAAGIKEHFIIINPPVRLDPTPGAVLFPHCTGVNVQVFDHG